MPRNWTILPACEQSDQLPVKCAKKLVSVLDKLASGEPVQGTIVEQDWAAGVFRWSPIPPDNKGFVAKVCRLSDDDAVWYGTRVVFVRNADGSITVISFGSKVYEGAHGIYAKAKRRIASVQ